MNCPIDNVEMNKTTREGIVIDYCPQCRGVWLDRGELDKIIERADTGFSDTDRDKKDELTYPKITDFDTRRPSTTDSPYKAPGGAWWGRLFNF